MKGRGRARQDHDITSWGRGWDVSTCANHPERKLANVSTCDKSPRDNTGHPERKLAREGW